MKKITFLLVLISMFGYAQSITLPSTQDRLSKDVLDINQKVNNVQYQLLQREMLVKDENYTFRLYRFILIGLSSNGIDGKFEINYDDNGNRTSLYSGWNSDSQSFEFNQSQKREYTYDDNGNMTLEIEYTRNSDSQSFVPSQKQEYTYDDNGNRTLIIIYSWNSDSQSFVPLAKFEIYYDDNGNMTFLNYGWNSDSQSFEFSGSQKWEYTYDDNGNMTLELEYTRNSDSQSFVPTYKTERTYDDNDNTTLVIQYYWNSVSQSFVQSNKYEYTWDARNLFIDEIHYKWYSNLGVFKPIYKTEFSIQSETDTNLILEGINYLYETNFNTWDKLEGEEFKNYFYYTKELSLSTKIVESNPFTIYPNPTDNTLFITENETPIAVTIYNVLGKEVLSINNTNNINVQALPSGVYVIRISDGVGQANRKFIKN